MATEHGNKKAVQRQLVPRWLRTETHIPGYVRTQVSTKSLGNTYASRARTRRGEFSPEVWRPRRVSKILPLVWADTWR